MNAWGTDASAVGNHEFDYGLPRLLDHIERADFPFLSANILDEATGETPDWLKASTVLRVNGVRVGVIGADRQDDAGARQGGRHRGPRVRRRGRADRGRVAQAASGRA